jgi:hypothetical protein
MTLIRKNIKKTFSIFLFIFFTSTQASNDNGVKNGNIRLSVGFASEHNDDREEDNYNLDTQIGYFINQNLELYFGLNTKTSENDTTFVLSPGINYYFYQTPIFTPYVGVQYYYQNTTNEFIEAQEGNTFYGGTHIFLSEDVALSPEFGVNYVDFSERKNTYFNTSLSYFF